VDGLRESIPGPWEWIWDDGREDRERVEVVEGAPDARRDIAGEGGAGRVDVSGSCGGDDVESGCELLLLLTDEFWIVESRVDDLIGLDVRVGLLSTESRDGFAGDDDDDDDINIDDNEEEWGVVGVGNPVGVFPGEVGDTSSDSGVSVDVDADADTDADVAGTRKVDLFAGVGVTGDEVLKSPKSALLLSPFSFNSRPFSFPSTNPLPDPLPLPTFVVVPGARAISALLALFPFPGGGAFTANSCAPGMGGGKKEEDGDGKGDEPIGVSTRRERRGCCWWW
jgi:hypothetical protein